MEFSLSPSAGGRTSSLEDQLCFALYSATNAVVRAYRPLLRELGLTYPQYLILLVLWHEDGQTVTELARRLKLAPHAISPMLDRMERNDVLRRRHDRADRRLVLVELTESGRALEDTVAAVQNDVRCETTLSTDELNEMRLMLQHLVVRMTSAGGDEPDTSR